MANEQESRHQHHVFRIHGGTVGLVGGSRPNLDADLTLFRDKHQAIYQPEYIPFSQALEQHIQDPKFYYIALELLSLVDSIQSYNDSQQYPRTAVAESFAALLAAKRYTPNSRRAVKQYVLEHENQLGVGPKAKEPVEKIKIGRDIDVVTIHRNLRYVAVVLNLAVMDYLPATRTKFQEHDNGGVESSWQIRVFKAAPDSPEYFDVQLVCGIYPDSGNQFLHLNVINPQDPTDILRIQIKSLQDPDVANPYSSISWDSSRALAPIMRPPQQPVDHQFRDNKGRLKPNHSVEIHADPSTTIQTIGEYPAEYADWDQDLWLLLSNPAVIALCEPMQLAHKGEFARQPDQLMQAFGRMIRKGVEGEAQLNMTVHGQKALDRLNKRKNFSPTIAPSDRDFMHQQIRLWSHMYSGRTLFEHHIDFGELKNPQEILNGITVDLMAAQGQNPARYLRNLIDTHFYKMIPAFRNIKKSTLWKIYDEVNQPDELVGYLADQREYTLHYTGTPDFVKRELEYDLILSLVTNKHHDTNAESASFVYGWTKMARAVRRHITELAGIEGDAELIATVSQLYRPRS